MDKYAFQLKSGKLATGHNLDDEIQSISMNFFDNDLKRFERLGAISQKIESFVPRIKPLHETPEKEIIMYCAFNGIKHFSEECCPFSWMAKRNAFREMLNGMESKFPGTKYSILRFFQQVKGKLLEKKHGKTISKINYCINCGFPSSGKTCKVCEMVEKLKNSTSKKAIKQPENVPKKPSNAKTCNELKILAT